MDNLTRIKFLENQLRRALQSNAICQAEGETIKKIRDMGWKNGLSQDEQRKIWEMAYRQLLQPSAVIARELIDYLRLVLDPEVWMPPDVAKQSVIELEKLKSPVTNPPSEIKRAAG